MLTYLWSKLRIQALVLKGDIDASYNHISKFATLVRQTLHFSDADLVDLEDEVNLLRIYLDLEKLRFSKDFDFQIIYNDIEGIEIPPSEIPVAVDAPTFEIKNV